MSMINIPAIVIANLMGLSILFVITKANSWQSKQIFQENKSLRIMVVICLICCISDPICFLADGKPGVLCFHLVYICNLFLFIGNVIISVLWIWLISSRMNIKIPELHKSIIRVGAILEFGLLVFNMFVPIIFYVDENNRYHRLGLYWVYLLYYAMLVLYAFVVYFVGRHKNGGLRYFPIWALVIPIAVGASLQTAFYGISTITPFSTVSLVCVYINLQDEFIYRDKLTGLYNRFFLDTFSAEFRKKAEKRCSMMMLDLNEFKSINDLYGHSAGDQALIHTAHVLLETVGPLGQVIRYAGDEFIVILSTQEDSVLEETVMRIKQALADFSKREQTPYTLSISIGYSKLNPGALDDDVLFETIDKLMYNDKQVYYKEKESNNSRCIR